MQEDFRIGQSTARFCFIFLIERDEASVRLFRLFARSVPNVGFRTLRDAAAVVFVNVDGIVAVVVAVPAVPVSDEDAADGAQLLRAFHAFRSAAAQEEIYPDARERQAEQRPEAERKLRAVLLGAVV